MPAVRIEEEAFGDERYDDLAAAAGLADADHARGKMARLWRQCTLEGTYALHRITVERVLGPKAIEALTFARLGELLDDGRVRVRGTEGRIEWLEKVRAGGKKGGRPRKVRDKTLRLSKTETSRHPREEQEQEQEIPDTAVRDIPPSELPDPGPSEDRVQPPPVDRGGVRAAGSKVPQDANAALPRRVSGSVVVKPDPARLARQALVERFRARMKVARAEIIGMYRLRARTEIPLMGGEDEVDLRRRLEEAGDQAEAMLEHAMELAIAEARKRKPPSVQWLGWIIGRSRVWNRLQRMSIDDIESSDKDGQSVFDMLDEMRAELVAKEKP